MDAGPAEFSALNNDLILDMIFKNLSTSTLLDCRLVNKKWNKIASDILKRRPVYVTISSWTTKTFKKLATICSNKNFPATGLKIADGNPITDLASADVKSFFKDYGTKFTRVYLAECSLDDDSSLIKLLGKYLPKVEELSLKFCELRGRKESSTRKLQLANVRRIRFEKDVVVADLVDKRVMKHVIRGAPNVEVIHGVALNEKWIFDELRSKKKLGNITSLILKGNGEASRHGIYKSLAQQPPVLTELTVKVPYSVFLAAFMEFQQCIYAILTASQNTLQKLAIKGLKISCENLPTIFTKLHTLELGIYYERFEVADVDWMSEGLFDLHSVEKFPALKRMNLVLKQSGRSSRGQVLTGSQEILEEYFWKPGTVWSRVDTLELNNHFHSDGMEYLAQVFPNVTQVVINLSKAGFLNIDAVKRKPSDVWYVRKFPFLEKLVLLDFPYGCENLHLESFLTGIPLSICKGLRQPPKQSFETRVDRVLRPYGGLWKLRKTGLRELELAFTGLRKPKVDAIMPQAAVWYGLEAIRGLRTTLRVPAEARNDLARALLHLRPHVFVECF